MLPKKNPTKTNSWNRLKAAQERIANTGLIQLFSADHSRFKKFSLEFEDVLWDFSKNIIDEDVLKLFEELFEECELQQAIDSQFKGEFINETEQRAVLHTALRNRGSRKIMVQGHDVMPDVRRVLDQMKEFSQLISNGNWKGYTGQPITDIVNIGIGGSDLGPAMMYEALKPYHVPTLKCHFVSNVDQAHISETLKDLDPKSTLFVIASKTFTTQETMANAHSARKWFLNVAKSEDHIAKHFVAVSTNTDKVVEFGIDQNQMFEFWDWVGGRYSVWSSIGLTLCCGIGMDNFEMILQGAYKMDEHFKSTPFKENIPMLMAAIGIWYVNFFNAESEAIIPYSQNLSRFAAYFQQGNMESNGKVFDRNGERVSYQTGPIVWGEPGTNGQHAFFQLIHQGTRLIPCDFIGFSNSHYDDDDHQHKLMANFFAQTEALLKGRSLEEAQAGTDPNTDAHRHARYREFEGGKPTTSILGKVLDPKTLGLLVAAYEHKIFVQGIVWNIYSYDQWGVELGKELAGKILPELQSQSPASHDSSTKGLIEYYLDNRESN